MMIKRYRVGLRHVYAAGCSAIALASFVVWPGAALAAWTYADMLRRISAGELPQVIMRLENCVKESGKPGPKMTAVTRFEAYNLVEKWIATSNSHLFMSGDGSMGLQYVRLRLLPDNTAQIYAQRLDPVTYRPALGEPIALTCKAESAALTFVAPDRATSSPMGGTSH